jgi:hypothetical protein
MPIEALQHTGFFGTGFDQGRKIGRGQQGIRLGHVPKRAGYGNPCLG